MYALGDPAGGVWPQMEVWVDGSRAMNVAVTDDVRLPYSTSLTLTTDDGIVDGNTATGRGVRRRVP